jgi:hypothetical protein
MRNGLFYAASSRWALLSVVLWLPPYHFEPPCRYTVSTTRVVVHSTQRRVGGISLRRIVAATVLP